MFMCKAMKVGMELRDDFLSEKSLQITHWHTQLIIYVNVEFKKININHL